MRDMGSWGSGAFDSDNASEFIDEAEESPGPATARALRLKNGYLDVDEGNAAWAACELVAIASGHGKPTDDRVRELAARVKPTAGLRKLALAALPRIADRESSELAQLWEGDEGFVAAIKTLRKRLGAKPRAVAKPKTRKPAPVRGPVDPWPAYRKDNAKAWAARRRKTTPGPFGDPEVLVSLNEWFDECGVANGFERLYDEAIGSQGFGRPNEDGERRTYARIGMVALWRGTWPKRDWPKNVRLPDAPGKAVLTNALKAARILVGEVLSADSELPMIWGDKLPPIVAKLTAALA